MSARGSRAAAGVPSRLMVNGLMVLTSVYFLFPVWWLLVSASKNNADLFATNGFWFAHWNLWANVREVFSYQGGLYRRWLLNSLLYAGGAAVLGTVVCGAAGYALAKFRFRGHGTLAAGVLAGLLVPSSLLTIPLYLLASSAHLTNTVWSVIVPSAVSPFGVFLARVYADASVPNELLEAARLDGAGEIRIFFSVVWRIISPVLITIGLFIFVGTWNNFMLPLVMLSDQHLFPLSLGLYGWQSYRGAATYNIVLTGSLIMVIPLVIGFFMLQRFWRSGLTLGSVTG